MSDVVPAAESVEPVYTSLRDHRAQQDGIEPETVTDGVDPTGTEAATTTAGETDAEAKDDVEGHHAADQRRDRSGKFNNRGRHRSRNQQASAEDVPRIQQLTSRAKGAEERAERAERELQQLRQQHAPPQQIAQAERRVESAGGDSSDPRPKDDDPKYGGDWNAYMDDHARWSARQEFQAQQRAQQQQAQVNQRMGAWAQRVTAAKEKYPDYEAVAFGPSAKIKSPDDVGGPGSPIDTFIIEDDGGAEIKYYLETHPQELESLLQMSGLGQVKTLTLLSQRLLSSTTSQPDQSNGAGAGRKVVVLPPKSRTPLRTEAQRMTDDDPNDSGDSVGLNAHRKKYGPR